MEQNEGPDNQALAVEAQRVRDRLAQLNEMYQGYHPPIDTTAERPVQGGVTAVPHGEGSDIFRGRKDIPSELL